MIEAFRSLMKGFFPAGGTKKRRLTGGPARRIIPSNFDETGNQRDVSGFHNSELVVADLVCRQEP